MKYEKFEEWMLGKKVTHVYAESSGVIVERPTEDDPHITVRVKYDEGCLAGGTLGARLCNLEFLEEKASEKPNQIDWQVGQVVWDVRNGRGVVKEISDDEHYPIYVEFDLTDGYGGAVSDAYTLDGRYVETQKVRSLFFSEPVITAELFPPKKSFIPTLKKGDVVLAKDYQGFRAIRVSSEDEHFVYNEDGTGFGKSGWEFRTLGEEIKFQ